MAATEALNAAMHDARRLLLLRWRVEITTCDQVGELGEPGERGPSIAGVVGTWRGRPAVGVVITHGFGLSYFC